MLSQDQFDEAALIMTGLSALLWGIVWHWNHVAWMTSTNGRSHFKSLARASATIAIVFAAVVLGGLLFTVEWQWKLLATRGAVLIASAYLAWDLRPRLKKKAGR